jgi:hypothetical protein
MQAAETLFRALVFDTMCVDYPIPSPKLTASTSTTKTIIWTYGWR